MFVDPSGYFSLMNVVTTTALVAYRAAVITSAIIRSMTVIHPPGSAVPGWRPDWDHRITFWEAAYWWRNGNGDSQSIPLRNVDLSEVSPRDFNGIGSTEGINLDFPTHYSDFNDAVVYGGLSLKLVNSREVEVAGGFDTFDFEKHPIRGSITSAFKTSLRNMATLYASASLGQGKPFKIYLTGKAPIGG